LPISLSPLPLFPWQAAQWSAQCARPSATTSGLSAMGFVRALASAGMASDRALWAAIRSSMVGCSRALKPRAPMTTMSDAQAPRASNETAPIRNHLSLGTSGAPY